MSGHYYAILMYRDLLWLADDGQTSKVIPNLTPQIPGDIMQPRTMPRITILLYIHHRPKGPGPMMNHAPPLCQHH